MPPRHRIIGGILMAFGLLLMLPEFYYVFLVEPPVDTVAKGLFVVLEIGCIFLFLGLGLIIELFRRPRSRFDIERERTQERRTL